MNDRIITRITITKDSLPNRLLINELAQIQEPQKTKFVTLNSHKMEREKFDRSNDNDDDLYSNRNEEFIGKCSNRLQTDDDECNTESLSPSSYTDAASGMTLGISIVQGSDNNVYVKDLVKNGPGERHGILIGDQVSSKLHEILGEY